MVGDTPTGVTQGTRTAVTKLLLLSAMRPAELASRRPQVTDEFPRALKVSIAFKVPPLNLFICMNCLLV